MTDDNTTGELGSGHRLRVQCLGRKTNVFVLLDSFNKDGSVSTNVEKLTVEEAEHFAELLNTAIVQARARR